MIKIKSKTKMSKRQKKKKRTDERIQNQNENVWRMRRNKTYLRFGRQRVQSSRTDREGVQESI
jgi:hypothetical protein